MVPQRPRAVSRYAEACLTALAVADHGRFISLGGAFGLAHYFEYRETKDVDAWWTESVTSVQRTATIVALEEALRPFGQVRTRSWGDVVSVELEAGGSTVFSDLVASKMVALVERGAPRDFLDIYMLCTQGKCSVLECWNWWETRQRLANDNLDRKRAALAIRTHLARLEQVRPLAAIVDMSQREAGQALRVWFDREFLYELSN